MAAVVVHVVSQPAHPTPSVVVPAVRRRLVADALPRRIVQIKPRIAVYTLLSFVDNPGACTILQAGLAVAFAQFGVVQRETLSADFALVFVFLDQAVFDVLFSASAVNLVKPKLALLTFFVFVVNKTILHCEFRCSAFALGVGKRFVTGNAGVVDQRHA